MVRPAQGGSALWSIAQDELLAYDEPFADQFDLPRARLTSNFRFRWTQLAGAVFLYQNTAHRVAESIQRIRRAMDKFRLGQARDLYESDLLLVTPVGRQKVRGAPTNTRILFFFKLAHTILSSCRSGICHAYVSGGGHTRTHSRDVEHRYNASSSSLAYPLGTFLEHL